MTGIGGWFCGAWRRRIEAAADGALLQEGDTAALSAHLLDCPSCRAHADAVDRAWRLSSALGPAARGAEWAEVPFRLPVWAPSALRTAVLIGLAGALVVASGPFALCQGALEGVAPEPRDVEVALSLAATLFGGLFLLRMRRSLEARLAPVLPWSRACAAAAAGAGAVSLAGAACILGMYLDVTCAVWGIRLGL